MSVVRYAFKSALLLAATLILNGNVAFAATPPNLPVEWRVPKGSSKMVLLDFYSDYCGACQMMVPHLQKLQKAHAQQLSIKHVNADQSPLPKAAANYQITGTPTYILYNASGEPVYRMTDIIAPAILQGQVQRALGQLPSLDLPSNAPLPKPLTGQEKNWGNMILLAYENAPNCPTCIPHAQLEAMAFAGAQTGLKLVYLNTDALPAWAEKSRPSKVPAYILLNNAVAANHSTKLHKVPDYGILLNVNSPMEPTILWRMIQLFSKTGL